MGENDGDQRHTAKQEREREGMMVMMLLIMTMMMIIEKFADDRWHEPRTNRIAGNADRIVRICATRNGHAPRNGVGAAGADNLCGKKQKGEKQRKRARRRQIQWRKRENL
jgi:hypothetical protein